jgi:hypothetical protein
MMIPRQEIDASLTTHFDTLRAGFFDLLAALILVVTGLVSCVHAVLRMMYAFVGLALWSLALLITFLYWARAWAVSRSVSASSHRSQADGYDGLSFDEE